MSAQANAPAAEAVQRPGWQALAFMAALLLGLAALVGFSLRGMAPAQAIGVGPTAAMRIVMLLLALLGAAHAVAAFRARAEGPGGATRAAEPAGGNRAALGWVLGGLLGLIAVLEAGGGFVVGASWLFAATARAFGQRMRLASPAIGLALAAAVYAFFTGALSLSLPAGPLERLLFG